MMRRTHWRMLLIGAMAAATTACGSLVQVPQAMQAGQQAGLSATPGAGASDATLPSLPGASPGAGLDVPGSNDPGLGTLPGTGTTGETTGKGNGHGTGTGTGTPGTGSSSPGSAGHSTAPPDRSPLTIGYLYPATSAANQLLGLSLGSALDPAKAMAALVSAMNANGGVAGRQLTVDYQGMNANAGNYSTEANAACAHFTQDSSVPVVLDLSLGNRFGMASCLAQRGVADFGAGTADTVDDNAVGLFASPNVMTSTRRYPAVLKGLHATGYLTSKNKIGVLLENCPSLTRAYQQAVRPAISRLKLHLVDTEQVDCATGFASAGPASSSVSSAVLRFRSRNVDRILIVSNFEQVLLLLLANHAQSQHWTPGYMLSSAAQAEVIRGSISSAQWPQLHGVGWSPGYDVDDPHTALSQPDQRCLGLIKKGGVTVTGWQNTLIATSICSHVFFLEAVLRATNGHSDPKTLMAGVASLGSKFVSPGLVGGRTYFSAGHRDGPAAVAPFAYVASCKCMKYTGRAMSVR